MAYKTSGWTVRMCFQVAVVVVAAVACQAQGPCGNSEHRALVLSGGGIKGAFEAGAVYHLVVIRGCDFHDFAGVSVGALNAAVLAQASPSADTAESLAQLRFQTEALVALWESFRSSRDIVRHRHLGGVLFVLFGAEQMNDFAPLRRTLEKNVSTAKLAAGRQLRIGVTSFWDGTYGEIAIGGGQPAVPPRRFFDYLYASSIIPVIGRMPRIADDDDEPNGHRTRQYGDGGLRHMTPISSYFMQCEGSAPECHGDARATPAHQSLQQLFVIVTSPYARGSDRLPAADGNCCRPGTTLITNGPRIMRRTITLMADTPHRSDLEAMWIANDMLRWRLDATNSPEGRLHLDHLPMFPIESYNYTPGEEEPGSRPYLIALVKPEKEMTDISNLLVLSPQIVGEQLLSGCLAADRVMASEFGLPPMEQACRARFAHQAGQVLAATGRK